MAIVSKEGLKPQDIKSIRIYLSEMAFGISCDSTSCGKMQDPRTGLEGKFSQQYCVANALLRGDTGLRAFTDEKVNDPQIREFMKRISVRFDEKSTKLETRVEIEVNSGAIYTKTWDVMKKIPEIRSKKAKVEDKFINLCSSVLGKSKTKYLMEIILSLEKLDNMKEFTEQIGI